ncbi:MAG: hypothetical protein HY473_01400 [Candidatus Sungbacteria bacterium]|uniref:Ig-like domain-containing protein n=2 Tax=Candidatus Sungiibacteriota bacterium TaxID=2750080 RepID=A0A932YZB6_9BACT|nr:hypothetical protein [Candidatus Sungbacteria bacterium]
MKTYLQFGTIIRLLLTAGLLAMAPSVFSQSPALFSLSVAPELPVAGDTVTVSVVPANFSATTTMYTWSRDGLPVSGAGGLGRSALSISTDANQSQIIQVRVAVDPGAGFSPAEQSTTIYTLPSPSQQQEVLSALQSEFTLRASDTNPAPGETVTVEVVTFAFDKDAASYQWYVNGALQRSSSGRAQSRLSVAAGSEGEVKTVRVEVRTGSGEFRTKSVTLRPTSVAVYWWAETLVPYWYKGKALPSLNSRVNVIALPSVPSPSLLTYRWEFNGGLIPQSSGLGKSTFSFGLNLPVEERVSVTLKDALGTLIKTAEVNVKPVSPTVGIYAVQPLRGIVYENRLTDFSAPSGNSYDFLAVPFFFAREREQQLGYTWTLDGDAIVGTFAKPWLFTLTSNAGEVSLSRLGVAVTDLIKAGERASASFEASLR